MTVQGSGGKQMEYIRKFQKIDLKDVMNIWFEGNLEAHDFVPEEFWKDHFGYVSRLIPKAEVYVYEIDGKVVGFIGIDDFVIQGFFMKKEYRGKGMGTRLLNYMEELYDHFSLQVFEKNYGAILYYEKQGFQKAGEEVHEDLGEVEFTYCYQRKKDGVSHL